MKKGSNVNKARTTIGDLIVAIVDAAREIFVNEQQAYHFTEVVLNRLARPVPARSVAGRIRLRRKTLL